MERSKDDLIMCLNEKCHRTDCFRKYAHKEYNVLYWWEWFARDKVDKCKHFTDKKVKGMK